MSDLLTIEREVVEWCRAQIGTPWQHTARAPGQGIDCIGLAVCSVRARKLPVLDMLRYAESPSPSQLLECVMQNCRRVNEIGPARLALFWIRRKEVGPTHAGMLTGEGTMVHAHREMGGGKVCEVALDERWLQRLHSVWEYPWLR